jgi:hypothetical protein
MDKQAYRIAVAGVGLGLVAFIFGAAIILKTGHHVSKEYWTAGSAVSGVLLGLLAPNPKATKRGKADVASHAAALAEVHEQARLALQGQAEETGVQLGAATTAHAAAASANAEAAAAKAPLTGAVAAGVLALIFIVSLIVGIEDNLTQFQSLAAAAGGALIGLIAPSPSTATA